MLINLKRQITHYCYQGSGQSGDSAQHSFYEHADGETVINCLHCFFLKKLTRLSCNNHSNPCVFVFLRLSLSSYSRLLLCCSQLHHTLQRCVVHAGKKCALAFNEKTKLKWVFRCLLGFFFLWDTLVICPINSIKTRHNRTQWPTFSNIVTELT